MNAHVKQIAVVDDEEELLRALCQLLELEGYVALPFRSGEAALAAIDTDFPGIVLSDVRMPGMDGSALFTALAARDCDLPVIMLSGHGDLFTAVDLMRRGAYDFISKPFTGETLLPSIARAMEKRALVLENRRLKENAVAGPIAGLIGESAAIERIRNAIVKLADTDISVLIAGESGTGKRLVAAQLHRRSRRSTRPLVTLDCSAMRAEDVESHIFGHLSGATPHAHSPHSGQLQRAQGGTLLFDHVDRLDAGLQARLARVLEDGVSTPLGASRPVPVDFRAIAATRCDLISEIAEGRFDQSFYFRLGGYVIDIPPLRDRREDIVPLFHAFVAEACDIAGCEPPPITPDTWRRLRDHHWPGNVRELRSFAIAASKGLAHGDAHLAADAAVGAEGLKHAVDQFEEMLIRDTLQRCKGDARAATAALKLPRKTFYDKLNRYAIDISSYRTPKHSA